MRERRCSPHSRAFGVTTPPRFSIRGFFPPRDAEASIHADFQFPLPPRSISPVIGTNLTGNTARRSTFPPRFSST